MCLRPSLALTATLRAQSTGAHLTHTWTGTLRWVTRLVGEGREQGLVSARGDSLGTVVAPAGSPDGFSEQEPLSPWGRWAGQPEGGSRSAAGSRELGQTHLAEQLWSEGRLHFLCGRREGPGQGVAALMYFCPIFRTRGGVDLLFFYTFSFFISNLLSTKYSCSAPYVIIEGWQQLHISQQRIVSTTPGQPCDTLQGGQRGIYSTGHVRDQEEELLGGSVFLKTVLNAEYT